MHKHNYEEDDSGYIAGYSCTKCGKFVFWLANVVDDCDFPDKVKEVYWDDTDYSKLNNEEIRRRLGGVM